MRGLTQALPSGARANAPAIVLPDRVLLLSALALLLFGLVMVASASVAIAERQTGDTFYYFYHQLVYAGIGVAGALIVFMVPMETWERFSFALLALSLLLLLLVLIPGIGDSVNGARRWVGLGPFQMQASEPARLGMVLYLAGYVVRRQAQLRGRLAGLIAPMVPISMACVLMLMEPDFGATAILLAVSLIMMFLAGARVRDFLVIFLVAAGALALLAVSSPYRMRRLVSFMNPWENPFTSGFQLVQSLIAVGRGHWFGVGLGNSVQKLLYLPEAHTDFLFAVLAEEFGLMGSLIVLLLFTVVLWRGFLIAGRALAAGRPFSAYLAYGLSSWFAMQAYINVAVNMGLLPTKGLTLPLMSYGGSSLVVMCALIALLLRIDYETVHAAPVPPPGRDGR